MSTAVVPGRRGPTWPLVLLALANGVFVLGVVVLLAGAAGSSGLDFEEVEPMGDVIIGRAIMLLAALVGLALAYSGTERRHTRGDSELR